MQQSMGSIMDELRREDPELGRRVREQLPRHELALVTMRYQPGLSQRQAAASMGRSTSAVSRMERGDSAYLSAEAIRRYARACNGTAGYVFVTAAGNETPEVIIVPLGPSQSTSPTYGALSRASRASALMLVAPFPQRASRPRDLAQPPLLAPFGMCRSAE